MADYGLGPYRPKPRGEFNSTTNYQYLDIVRYNGSSYINCNLDTVDGVSCIGIFPEGQPQSELYWMCIGSKGDKGDIADTYAPYISIANGVWDFSQSDKCIIPSNGANTIEIRNLYDGCCGVMISPKEITLPANSLISSDFNYISITASGQYYFYTFTYTKLDNDFVLIWHRTVVSRA